MGFIPEFETHALDIISFDLAYEESLATQADYCPEEWLYVPSYDLEYRYILGTRGSHPLITIGINPSTARPNDLDNTLKSVERIAKYNGYDSFIMFNVYAQRATKPDDMDLECNYHMHKENMAAFAFALSQEKWGEPHLWAAWGTVIEKRPWLSTLVKDMVSIGNLYQAKWFSAGKRSKKGHPHHPLYLRKDSELEDFPIRDYLLSL